MRVRKVDPDARPSNQGMDAPWQQVKAIATANSMRRYGDTKRESRKAKFSESERGTDAASSSAIAAVLHWGRVLSNEINAHVRINVA